MTCLQHCPAEELGKLIIALMLLYWIGCRNKEVAILSIFFSADERLEKICIQRMSYAEVGSRFKVMQLV